MQKLYLRNTNLSYFSLRPFPFKPPVFPSISPHRPYSQPSTDTFRLPKTFVDNYNPALNPSKRVAFGFNGLGELAYKRTYSRVRDSDGRKEQWHETVERVVNGTFTMYLRHAHANNLTWDADI